MAKHNERERKVDIDKLTADQADALSIEIGKEIAKIMDEANLKCNELLNIYGLQTKIGYKITKKKTVKKIKKEINTK